MLPQSGIYAGLHTAISPAAGNSLFVKGLAKGVTERHLHCLFSPFGQVVECQVARHRSGRSAGFAVICFLHQADAQRAQLLMDNTLLAGRKLNVRWYTPDVHEAHTGAQAGGPQFHNPGSLESALYGNATKLAFVAQAEHTAAAYTIPSARQTADYSECAADALMQQLASALAFQDQPIDLEAHIVAHSRSQKASNNQMDYGKVMSSAGWADSGSKDPANLSVHLTRPSDSCVLPEGDVLCASRTMPRSPSQGDDSSTTTTQASSTPSFSGDGEALDLCNSGSYGSAAAPSGSSSGMLSELDGDAAPGGGAAAAAEPVQPVKPSGNSSSSFFAHLAPFSSTVSSSRQSSLDGTTGFAPRPPVLSPPHHVRHAFSNPSAFSLPAQQLGSGAQRAPSAPGNLAGPSPFTGSGNMAAPGLRNAAVPLQLAGQQQLAAQLPVDLSLQQSLSMDLASALRLSSFNLGANTTNSNASRANRVPPNNNMPAGPPLAHRHSCPGTAGLAQQQAAAAMALAMQQAQHADQMIAQLNAVRSQALLAFQKALLQQPPCHQATPPGAPSYNAVDHLVRDLCQQDTTGSASFNAFAPPPHATHNAMDMNNLTTLLLQQQLRGVY